MTVGKLAKPKHLSNFKDAFESLSVANVKIKLATVGNLLLHIALLCNIYSHYIIMQIFTSSRGQTLIHFKSQQSAEHFVLPFLKLTVSVPCGSPVNSC